MLLVATSSGLGPGYHGVDDLAVLIQAGHAGAARDHLLSVLDRLGRHPAGGARHHGCGAARRTGRDVWAHPDRFFLNSAIAKERRAPLAPAGHTPRRRGRPPAPG